MLAIIGGSGFYQLGKKIEDIDVTTPYGITAFERVKLFKKEIVFLARHGKDHRYPPHMVNYRANIYALKKIGATAAFATHACGILSKYTPGDIVMLTDFIGLGTPITFYDDFSAGMRHTDFTEPYNKELQDTIFACARYNKIPIKKDGIVVTTTGPRYETKAEVRHLKKTGANLVSMTASYEATLMKEMEIPFAAIAICTNKATGLQKKQLNQEEILEVMSKTKLKISTLVNELSKEVE